MTDQIAGPAPTSAEQETAATVWAKTRKGFSQGTWSLRRRLALAFVVAGVLLLIGSVLGALALNSLVERRQPAGQPARSRGTQRQLRPRVPA